MKVLKFGGSSIESVEKIGMVADIVSQQKTPVFLVFSALGGVTARLVELADMTSANRKEISESVSCIIKNHSGIARSFGVKNSLFYEKLLEAEKELSFFVNTLPENIAFSPEKKDALLAFGEELSLLLLSACLKSRDMKVLSIPGTELLCTDSNFGNACVDIEKTRINTKNRCREAFNRSDIVLTSGFIAKSPEGFVTTIGRGGGDYSASVFALGCDAEKVEIWTDVPGIMTSDPRVIPEAEIVRKLSYKEAAELSFFGAKVLHPRTIFPAISHDIPVVIRNTATPGDPGTRVDHFSDGKKRVKAIAFQKNITVLNIHAEDMVGVFGFLSKVFDVFTANKTAIDLVTTSEMDISVSIEDTSRLDAVKRELSEFSDVTVMSDMSLISAVGEGIKFTSGIASRFFGVLSDINIYMVSVGASEVNLSVIVHNSQMVEAVKRLHSEFF